VKESMADDDSVFYFYKKMIAYRKSNLSMIYGEYIPLDAENEKVYSYLRKGDAGEFLVMLNFTGEMVPVPALNETADRQMELEIGNYIDKGDNKTLRSYEARIYKVL
jgi:oligo-1,6-glucosidase